MDTFIQIVLVTSFLIHGLLKNLVIGGVPIIILAYYRSTQGEANAYYRSLARGLSSLAPITMGLAMVFGLMVWGIVQANYSWSMVSLFGSVTFGWIVCATLLLMGFWGVRHLMRNQQDGENPPWAMGTLVTLCLLAITGMFVMSHVDMLTLTVSAKTVGSGTSTLWPRYFHTVFSGLAITGLALTLYGSLRPQCQEDHEVDPAPYDIRLVRYGVGWMLGGTVPQVVVGPWFLLALPSDVRFHLIDGTSAVSIIFFVSLTLTLLALVLLNSSLMVPQKRGLVWGGTGSLILTTVFMVMIREEVRKLWLTTHGIPSSVGELSWIVVISVLAIMAVGLFLGGRYVKLTYNNMATR